MNQIQVAQDICCYCCGGELSTVFAYHEPPPGETRFSFSDAAYFREILQCNKCAHFMSVHAMNDKDIYGQDYVDSTYGGDRLIRAFEKIVALDRKASDNIGRCDRVVEFADQCNLINQVENGSPTILDVGSGLCVFLYEMKQRGWNGTALDPDPRAIAHAQDVVRVAAVCGDFFECDSLGLFDVVAFNKVLEHVRDPIAMLSKSKDYLSDGGFVYIELPDGEIASIDGAQREEFFVEHHHIFSLLSLAKMATRSGFTVRSIERLQEPSTKYTLRACLTPA